MPGLFENLEGLIEHALQAPNLALVDEQFRILGVDCFRQFIEIGLERIKAPQLEQVICRGDNQGGCLFIVAGFQAVVDG